MQKTHKFNTKGSWGPSITVQNLGPNSLSQTKWTPLVRPRIPGCCMERSNLSYPVVNVAA